MTFENSIIVGKLMTNQQAAGQQVVSRKQGYWEGVLVEMIYKASKTGGQIALYCALWCILFILSNSVIDVLGAKIGSAATTTLQVCVATAVVLKLLLKSLVWLTSDEILVVELPILKGKMVSRKLDIPEVTGEVVGTMWQTQNEIPYDAGFVPRRGAFALIPLWGIEYARVRAQVRLVTVDETIAMLPEPSVVSPAGGTTSAGNASREVRVRGTFRWTPIAELAGSFVGKVGKKCEREAEMEALLRAHAVGALRSVITARGLTCSTVGQARGDLTLAFEKSFGDPTLGAQNPELFLIQLEVEYGVTTGDFTLTDVAVVGSDKDADALRKIAESEALRAQEIARLEGERIVRDKGLKDLIALLDTVKGLSPSDKARAIQEYERNNGARPAPVAGGSVNP